MNTGKSINEEKGNAVLPLVNGRNYRCIRKPDNDIDLGRWEFEYKGIWHDVKNMLIRRELNKFAGYYAR